MLWNYDPSQDEEIYRAYQATRDAGVLIFILLTAAGLGTFELNGRAEILLGQFERRYLHEKSSSSSRSKADFNIFDYRSFFRNVGNDSVATTPRNRQQVATKFAPNPWRITRGSLVQAAKESLKRLEQDKLCVAQLHWSTANYQPLQEGELYIIDYPIAIPLSIYDLMDWKC